MIVAQPPVISCGLCSEPGRGALEIDILEVLPGSYGPNYKKDKALYDATMPEGHGENGDDWERLPGFFRCLISYSYMMLHDVTCTYLFMDFKITFFFKVGIDVGWLGQVQLLNLGGRAAKKITTGVMRRWRLAFANLKARSFIPSWICHGHICRALSIGVSFPVDLPFHISSWIYLKMGYTVYPNDHGFSRCFMVFHCLLMFFMVHHGLPSGNLT